MISILLLSCFLGFLPLPSTKNNGVISEINAHDVDYDGKKISLKGDVKIEHKLGKLFCQRAIIYLQQNNNKILAPDFITLEGNCRAELHDGSILTSQNAEINCQTLEGLFTAKLPEKVVYIAQVQEGDKKVPVKTSSSSLHVRMKKKEDSSEYVVSDMRGEGAVSIEYITKEEKKE